LGLEIGMLRMERNDRSQGKVLRTWVEAVLQQMNGQVLPFAAKTALHCAVMHVPDAKSMRYSMIATTALQHGLALVTRNVADFAGIHRKLINPWEVEVQHIGVQRLRIQFPIHFSHVICFTDVQLGLNAQ
jgi:hypothetical protein